MRKLIGRVGGWGEGWDFNLSDSFSPLLVRDFLQLKPSFLLCLLFCTIFLVLFPCMDFSVSDPFLTWSLSIYSLAQDGSFDRLPSHDKVKKSRSHTNADIF